MKKFHVFYLNAKGVFVYHILSTLIMMATIILTGVLLELFPFAPIIIILISFSIGIGVYLLYTHGVILNLRDTCLILDKQLKLIRKGKETLIEYDKIKTVELDVERYQGKHTQISVKIITTKKAYKLGFLSHKDGFPTELALQFSKELSKKTEYVFLDKKGIYVFKEEEEEEEVLPQPPTN